MEPTLKSDDLILTELSQGKINGDSIYVLRFGNDLTLRRIQRKMNGSLLMISDSKKYEPEEMDRETAKSKRFASYREGSSVWSQNLIGLKNILE